MEFTYFIGIDVSKNELDFALMRGREFVWHKETANTPEAVRTLLRELAKEPGFVISKAVFCMEHTGIYNNHLLAFLHKKKANICLEAASQIKSSMGNVRGKNDKVDSIRIAEYAYKNRDGLRLWQPKREIVQRLAHLSASRTRLIGAQKILRTPLDEAGTFVEKKVVKENTCQRTLNSIAADLEKVEKAIDQLIASDGELKRLFGIITSVQGVGAVTATQILLSTNEFRDISDPKKFACYSGVAPFVRESGLMKGKARVSHLANKKVKTLLHMSAVVAICHNEDMKKYYERKLAEGKNKMLVINAVRNKLIHRIFTCVNQNRKYNKTYTPTLA
jgi:transposase